MKSKKEQAVDKLNDLVDKVNHYEEISKESDVNNEGKIETLDNLKEKAKDKVVDIKNKIEPISTMKETTSNSENSKKPKSLENILDDTLNELSTSKVNKDYAYIAPIRFNATIEKGTKFLDKKLVDVMTPKDEPMGLSIQLDNSGINIRFEPFLYVDVAILSDSHVYGVFFDFRTGETEVDAANGLTNKVKSVVRDSVSDMIKGTLLDRSKQQLPYRPFEDNNLQENLVDLQRQVLLNFTPENPKKKKKEEDPLEIPMTGITLSGGIKFKEDFIYDFGVGQAIIRNGANLRTNVRVKGDLLKPASIIILEINIETDGIHIDVAQKAHILIKKISLRHGGEFEFDEMEITDTVSSSNKLADALDTVVDELLLPIIETQIKGFLLKVIDDRFQETLEGQGIDARLALGI